MLGAVISPLPLSVSPSDLILIAEVQRGKEQGKSVYMNTRWIRENASVLFSGEDESASLVLMENELKSCDNIHATITCWVEETSILTLTMEEVPEFNQFYELSKDPEMISILTDEEYEEGTTVAEVLLINGLDILMNISRRSSGGK